MSNHTTTKSVHFIPLGIGVLLWAAATALLLEEAWHHQKFDVATMATPILTAATVAAAVLAHLRFASWRLIGGTGFALLALLGSTIMATGTLGRLAEANDAKQSDVQRVNRDYGYKKDELDSAKKEQKAECKKIGPKCEAWNKRVDSLTASLAGITVRSSDPKADSIARLATLLGFDGKWIREVVQAFDPALLPLFLEGGSIGFFAGAFKHRNRKQGAIVVSQPLEVAPNHLPTVTVVTQPWTQAEALADFKTLGHMPSQSLLAKRWLRDPGTVSRWVQQWERENLVERRRIGRDKVTLALPAPR